MPPMKTGWPLATFTTPIGSVTPPSVSARDIETVPTRQVVASKTAPKARLAAVGRRTIILYPLCLAMEERGGDHG